jgi:energy-coupling factor transporter ATP-binding protein EcfA2
MNDQFRGADAWEKYLVALETAMPTIHALGVTDYYSTESYERVREAHSQGRIANCELIFPNIEMRLGVGTSAGAWVNMHLLVSPEDPDHLVELRRFLPRLNFRAFDDAFSCTPDDLIRLGKRADPTIASDLAALEYGSQQFKVSLEQLQREYRESAWAKANILIAVAGGKDGTSGVQEGADATLRQEIEKFAHVIFASSPAQREFWLGQRAASLQDLRRDYNGPKPCLHGSDAHDHQTVGLPDGNRFSWVKGAVEFDALRQACIDPASRAYVGETPPVTATPSQVISKVELVNTPWALTPAMELNPGLVAIIGPRGSGKTALADIIAVGCDAANDRLNDQSFIVRAEEFLGGASVHLTWQNGDLSQRGLLSPMSDEAYPRVRYLSQQFVENLCSSAGMTDALLQEIERVVFEAQSVTARDGAIDFEELLDYRATRFRQAREREEEALGSLCERIGTELEKRKQVPTLRNQVIEKERLIERYVADRTKLVSKGGEVRVARLQALMNAAEKVRSYLRWFSNQQQALLAMKDEVLNTRQSWAPEELRRGKERHRAGGLEDAQWEAFLLDYTGEVDHLLQTLTDKARENAATWRGTPPAEISETVDLIAADAELERQPLALLEAEIGRLEKQVSIDRATAERFAALSKRVTEETAALARLKERLADCEQAQTRIPELVQERTDAYVRVFDAVLNEQAVLVDLYAPLMERLAGSGETLSKLSFSVTRTADVQAWASQGEALLDLRRQGPFKGKGSLRQAAEAALKSIWEHGTAKEISAALAKFREENEDLRDVASMQKGDQDDFRTWAKGFAKWMYGTDHIHVRYSVDYDGVDIRKLSPGTRGIVLLLLYLALDNADDRPLVIDQPEENLDPKSIYHELVGLFTVAKGKRQVIMVTHNANLVINTDADQIIVASAGPHPQGQLPPITYVSGGLESAEIRQAVCDILEGGEDAFRDRARRLRVRLDR